MPAKRPRTWQATRDFVTFTVTGPCSRSAATNVSKTPRSPGREPAKNSSSDCTRQECGMFRVTNSWWHVGQRQSSAGMVTGFSCTPR